MKVSSKKLILPILVSLWMTCLASSLLADALSVTMTPASDQIVLKNENVNFSCSPSGGCTPYTYSWSFQNATPGSSTSQSSSATFGASAEGNENTAAITVTDKNGATASKNITVKVPKVKTQTVATVPADQTRKTVGVGESVNLTIVPSSIGTVGWTVAGDGSVDSSGLFIAGETASSSKITATFGGGKTIDTTFTVVEPANETAIKQSEDSIPSGVQGAGMRLEITINPTNVSFENVESQEVNGPATNIMGYFTNYPAASLAHITAGWVRILPGNLKHDHAAFSGYPPPWSSGGFQWIIPIQWRVVGKNNIKTLPNRVQTFSIGGTNGFSTVTKLGQFVERLP